MVRKLILVAALFAVISPAMADTLEERQVAAQRQRETTAAIIAAEQARSAAVAAYPLRNPRGGQ